MMQLYSFNYFSRFTRVMFSTDTLPKIEKAFVQMPVFTYNEESLDVVTGFLLIE